MSVEILMPKLGQISEELTLVRWLKKRGERVIKGEPLFEVSTDKANVEVEATADGILTEIFVNEGETVPVLTVLGVIDEASEVSSEETLSYRIKASPIAKKLAKEYNIDLSQIKGTGPDGRIVKEDILKVIQKEKAVKEDVVPISGIRKVIAQRMAESKSSIPHFYIKTSINMTETINLKKALDVYLEKQNLKVSYTAMIIKALGIALLEFPILNSLVEGEEVHIIKDVNIGIAVALDEGIVVPVLHRVNEKSLIEIAKELEDIIKRAREGILDTNIMNGGTFTLSNLGMYNIEEFTAIINPPQVAILAVGRIEEKPVVKNSQVVVQSMMSVTLSCDHRVIDGVIAARFLEKLKYTLENPFILLIER